MKAIVRRYKPVTLMQEDEHGEWVKLEEICHWLDMTRRSWMVRELEAFLESIGEQDREEDNEYTKHN